MAPAISWGFLHSLIWALTRSIEIPHIVHKFHIIVASLLYFKRVVFYFCLTLPAVYRSLIGKYCLDYKLLSNINFGSNHIYGVWLCSLPLRSRHLPWLLVIPLRWLSSRRTIIWRALRVWYSVHRAKRTIINKFDSKRCRIEWLCNNVVDAPELAAVIDGEESNSYKYLNYLQFTYQHSKHQINLSTSETLDPLTWHTSGSCASCIRVLQLLALLAQACV